MMVATTDNGDQGQTSPIVWDSHIECEEGPISRVLFFDFIRWNWPTAQHNFRNPTSWHSIRLEPFGKPTMTTMATPVVNYVMEGGNFGYWGPTAKHWWEDKGMHFHSDLPGVVPNIGRTGAGAPCGLVVYEGKLLPTRYRGQLIHAEAGKRLINTYFVSPEGAGYSLKAENTVSAADPWFRPSDVAVSPDGAPTSATGMILSRRSSDGRHQARSNLSPGTDRIQTSISRLD
jgi:hypothetical protein